MKLEGSKTEANLIAALAGESQASVKYQLYAEKARQDGYEEMAQIFETTVEMLLVCPFYEEESDALTPDGDGKYIFGIVKVSERGQITLPKHARKVFGIEAGDRLLVLGDEKKGMALAKIKNPFDKLMK